jgi:hypothetical protein
MQKSLLFVFFLISSFQVFGQKDMKKTELSADYFLVDVKSNGSSLFASKYQSACIAYHKKNKEFLLYGDVNGVDIIFLERVPKVPLRFYPDKFVSCEYKEGKIYLSSQVTGKATVVTGIFNWVDEHLVWEKEIEFDLSLAQVSRADLLLKNGKVSEALATYDSVQYAENYFDAQKIGIEILLASSPVIENLMTKNKFKDAVELTDRIFAFKGMKWLFDLKAESDLKNTLGKNLFGLNYTSLQLYFETYTANLVEAKLYDKAIEKVNGYWKYFTNSADLMLNLANAWYGKKDKNKASEWYEKYTSQMIQLKKEKNIPYYVPQRIIKK